MKKTAKGIWIVLLFGFLVFSCENKEAGGVFDAKPVNARPKKHSSNGIQSNSAENSSASGNLVSVEPESEKLKPHQKTDYARFRRVLKRGNQKNPVEPRGDDVALVQTRLRDIGIVSVRTLDGWFGKYAEAAVVKLQKFMGFAPGGRVDKIFWNILFNYRIPEEMIILIKFIESTNWNSLKKARVEYRSRPTTALLWFATGKAARSKRVLFLITAAMKNGKQQKTEIDFNSLLRKVLS